MEDTSNSILVMLHSTTEGDVTKKKQNACLHGEVLGGKQNTKQLIQNREVGDSYQQNENPHLA